MPTFKVTVMRAELQRAEVLVEAKDGARAALKVEEEGVDVDLFETAGVCESVERWEEVRDA